MWNKPEKRIRTMKGDIECGLENERVMRKLTR